MVDLFVSLNQQKTDVELVAYIVHGHQLEGKIYECDYYYYFFCNGPNTVKGTKKKKEFGANLGVTHILTFSSC